LITHHVIGISPFGLVFNLQFRHSKLPGLKRTTARSHFWDLRPLPQGQGWLRTYFDIWGKAPGETFSPEEFTARKRRWKQWAADRRTN
jgi:hypothetical protein